MIYALMLSNASETERAISKHLEPKDQRNIEDKITQLKKKVCVITSFHFEFPNFVI